MSRSRLSVAAPTLVLVLWACTTGDVRTPDHPADQPSPKPALLYARGATLVVRPVDGGRAEEIARLPSADIAVAPDGLRFAVVEETDPAGSLPEGFSRPRLRVGEVGGEARPLGPGRAPLWSPRGNLVAAIAPDERCDAEPEKCGERLVVYDPHGQTVMESPPAPAYSLLGWLEADSLLALAAPGRVVVATDGALRPLGLSPAEVWGSSPVSDLLLIVGERRSELVDSEGGSVARVELGRLRLGDGTWSPDGKRIAAVAFEAEGFELSSRLVVIDAASGEVTGVPGSDGAQGQVVWSTDGRFAYVRVHPRRPQRLQALACEESLRCEPVFSWRQGITLLALR